MRRPTGGAVGRLIYWSNDEGQLCGSIDLRGPGIGDDPLPMHARRPATGSASATSCFGDGPPLVLASNIRDLNSYRHGWPHTQGRHGPAGWPLTAGHPLVMPVDGIVGRSPGLTRREVRDRGSGWPAHWIVSRSQVSTSRPPAGGRRMFLSRTRRRHSSGGPESLGVGYAVSPDTAVSAATAGGVASNVQL
jgi:hypothetical protein